ncbi:MAG: hypothetical protein WAK84_12765 [Candidatus Cybelea sp.]
MLKLALGFYNVGTIWAHAALSQDTRGAASPFLERILKTHWVRTALINASGLILLAWSILILR